MPTWPRSISLALLVVMMAATSTWAQVPELAKRLPSSSNVILVVNVEQVLASPIAKANDWKFKLAKARLEGVSILPPEAKTAVFGMEIDLEQRTQLHEAVVMQLDEEPNLPGLAKRVGGELDQFGAHAAVALPGDAFVVRFGDKQVAAIAPGNRQMVARWVRETDARSAPALAPYLNDTIKRAAAEPFLLAIDLENAVTAKQIQGVLAETAGFKNHPKLDELAVNLASMRGASLSLTFGETTQGTLTIELGKSVALTPTEAKTLMLGAIARNGVMLEEFAEWQPTVADKRLTLSGELGASGRRRIFSLFSPPPSIKEPSTEGAESQSNEALASQQYYKHIAALIKDLHHKKTDTSSAQTMGQWAAWYESYARKIDQLPVLNVDPELVSFAGYVAQSFRNACQAIRQGAANSRVRQVNVKPVYNTYTHNNVYGYTYRWDGSGGPVGTTSSVSVYDKYAVQQEKTIARTEERIGAYGSANEIMSKVEQSLGEIRQKMTAKHKIEF